MTFALLSSRLRHAWLRAFLAIVCLLGALPAMADCTVTGACITAGPRLASVDTGKSALLGPLLSGMLGTGTSLNAVDWNALAGGNLNLLNFLNVLKTDLGVSTPAQALSTNVTLVQIANALAVEAQAEAKPQLAGADATAKGVYFRVRMKFDENTLQGLLSGDLLK